MAKQTTLQQPPPQPIHGASAEGPTRPERAGVPALPSRALPSLAFTIWTGSAGCPVDLPVHGPVLIVIRGMPDPRYVLCRLGERKDLVCHVRVAVNFRRGMMLYGARPCPQRSERAWEYLGKLPRRPGRW
jgi:hypothetical protein